MRTPRSRPTRPGRSLVARLRHRDHQAGSYTPELAIIVPVVLLLFCGAVQIGLWYMGRDAAHTAARKAVEVGRSSNATPEQGAARARTWLSTVGNLQDPQVSTGGSTADRVRITVTGHVVTLVPGWQLRISQSAQGPVERWTVNP